RRAVRPWGPGREGWVVASVSCIYGLGDPEEYGQNSVSLRVGEVYKRDKILRRLTDIYYERNDYDLSAGKFRVRGDTLEVHPSSQEIVVRISFWGDELLRGRRELLAAPVAARGWQHALDAARLLPRRLRLFRRRVAHDHSAGARYVQRRPRAQGGAGRVRLPPAVRHG